MFDRQFKSRMGSKCMNMWMNIRMGEWMDEGIAKFSSA